MIRADRLHFDRFDALMIGAMAVLAAVIGLVILHGDQIGGAKAVGSPRIIYLGPVNEQIQNLWMVDPRAPGTPHKLTDSATGVMDFDVAPDGRIIYTEQYPSGESNILVYDPLVNQSQLLYACKDASCMEVAVRPDGKLIAFDRSALNTGTNLPPGAPRIWLFDLQTRQARSLYPDNQLIGYGAHWSPDGSKLAFFNSDQTSGGIIIYDFATGKDTLISASQGTVGTFSPDSRRFWFPKIVEVREGGQVKQYTTHLVIVDVSAQPYTQHDLIPDGQLDDDTDAMWLPDGQSLLVARRPADSPLDQDKQIFRVDVSSGKAVPLLVDKNYLHSNLSLGADGQTVLLQRFPMGSPGARPEIWLYDLKSAELRKVADNGNLPHWLP